MATKRACRNCGETDPRAIVVWPPKRLRVGPVTYVCGDGHCEPEEGE